MDSQVEEIKHKLDIVNIISSYLPLKKRGRHFLARCPFHQEKTPSFIVSPELQIFKCFGCGKAGDVFTFVQEYERIDFREALEQLAKLAGITLVRSSGFTQEESRRKTLIGLNQETARFYNYILTSHPLGKTALNYVLTRGIALSTIKTFQIGFSPSNPQLLVNYLSKKGFKIADLLASGTFGQSQYGSGQLYDRFQGRLTFALSDYRGQVLGFSGRVLPNAKPDLAKYINSPETEIYHKSQMLYGLHLAKESIRKSNSVIVVEGEFDMISPYQIGVTNIVALKGTAFTPEQLQLLKRYTDTLILGLDSDFAGNNAARKSIELADSLEFDLEVLDLEDKFKDPDEAVKNDPDFFREKLSHPIPVYDFLIRSAVKNYGTDSVKGKKQILTMVLPFLIKITNSVIRSDYFRLLASQLGSDVDSIHQEAAKYQTASNPAVSAGISGTPIVSIGATKPESSTEKMEESLLILILGAKKPAVLAKKLKRRLDLISTPRFQNILHGLLAVPKFDPQTFHKELPPELQPVFSNLFLAATAEFIESRRRLHEISKTINLIDLALAKSRLKELSLQISQQDGLIDSPQSKNIELEYNQLLSRLSRLQSSKT